MPSNEERLARFEGFASDMRAELAQTLARLDDLRAQGKVKTATYRQLFSNSLMLREMVARLEDRGL